MLRYPTQYCGGIDYWVAEFFDLSVSLSLSLSLAISLGFEPESRKWQLAAQWPFLPQTIHRPSFRLRSFSALERGGWCPDVEKLGFDVDAERLPLKEPPPTGPPCSFVNPPRFASFPFWDLDDSVPPVAGFSPLPLRVRRFISSCVAMEISPALVGGIC